MSPTLGYFGDKHATHHLAAFARLSILYDNAFASALACSPSPSCIIIGLPEAKQGTHNIRSSFPIPKAMFRVPDPCQ